MLTIQYTGKGERTVGIEVVYPGELLHATPSLLAAWQAEHGDVFVVVGSTATVEAGSAGTIVITDGAAHVFDDVTTADVAAAEATPKARRK